MIGTKIGRVNASESAWVLASHEIESVCGVERSAGREDEGMRRPSWTGEEVEGAAGAASCGRAGYERKVVGIGCAIRFDAGAGDGCSFVGGGESFSCVARGAEGAG